MIKPIEQEYENEYKALQNLFGYENINACIDRLNIIHAYTEGIWSKYISNIPNKQVNYLLIAEAPPWSNSGPPQYFLDPKSRSRTLMKAFKKAFSNNIPNDDPKTIINGFAKNGLLLIDSIPFSMDYKGKRNNKNYKELVSLSVISYMLNKLNHSGLIFSKNMKIAFGYEANAGVVINALGGVLKILHHEYSINENMICTNTAHYPDANKIRKIFTV